MSSLHHLVFPTTLTLLLSKFLASRYNMANCLITFSAILHSAGTFCLSMVFIILVLKACSCAAIIISSVSIFSQFRAQCSNRARWPLAPNFYARATRKSQIFHTKHMLGTLDFTGSQHWAPFNFPYSTALRLPFFSATPSFYISYFCCVPPKLPINCFSWKHSFLSCCNDAASQLLA